MLAVRVIVAALAALPPGARHAPDPVPGRAAGLRVEQLADPLGIDSPQPRFSWQLDDTTLGARQTGYRLLVASDSAALTAGRADAWNSGVVDGNATLDVSYGGAPLEAMHRYYWTVCIREAGGGCGAVRGAALVRNRHDDAGMAGRWIAATRAPLDSVAHDPLDGDTTSSAPAGRRCSARRSRSAARRPRPGSMWRCSEATG